jgi:hypothetical protein
VHFNVQSVRANSNYSNEKGLPDALLLLLLLIASAPLFFTSRHFHQNQLKTNQEYS